MQTISDSVFLPMGSSLTFPPRSFIRLAQQMKIISQHNCRLLTHGSRSQDREDLSDLEIEIIIVAVSSLITSVMFYTFPKFGSYLSSVKISMFEIFHNLKTFFQWEISRWLSNSYFP